MKKRVEADDAMAIYTLGCLYELGEMGCPQNIRKANKLWLRAGELGHAMACHNLAYACHNGEGVKCDVKKAKYYYELGAMGGHVSARHNLGILEENAGNFDRAVKHYMIAAGAGCDESLNEIKDCYLNGHATKDDFEKALRTHKNAKDEMKSEQREAAAAGRRNQG